MTNLSCIRRLCIALCLLYPLRGSAAGPELTRVQSDPYGETPSLLLEFSAEPKWKQVVDSQGDKKEFRLEFDGVTNAATQDGYHREFSDAPSFADALDISTETDEGVTRLVVRLTFPRTFDATVTAGDSVNALVVTMSPGAVGALVPIVGAPAEAAPSSARVFYVVGGLILLVGAGAVAAYFIFQGSGGNRAGRTTVAIPVEEAKTIMREDAEAYREAADAALDGSHERHRRLVRIVRQDMSEMRLEMKSLAGEFERATQSVLLFGEPFVPQSDDAPTELGAPAAAQAVEHAGSFSADVESASESVATPGSKITPGSAGDSPYARARRMVQDGADLAEVGRITGLSSAELDLLARLGRMKSGQAPQVSHAE